VTPQRLRFHLSLIVTLSGVTAFLSSMLALAAGMESMTIRYPVAVACGYAAFLLLIRAWIALHQHGKGTAESGHFLDVVAPDLLGARLPSRLGGGSDVAFFAGGRSGGAGAGLNWSGAMSSGRSSNTVPSLDLDLDDLWPVVLAVVCVLGGALAIGYVIYTAPVFLAEVAVDAAIVSGIYRKLKKREPSHWALTVVRHTAIPALVLIVFAALGGYAAHLIAPEARSIGGVIRALDD
jgi:hypothetical protein